MLYTMTCPTCDNEFTTKRSKNSPPPKFCSLKCRGFAQRGTKNPGVSRALRLRVGPKHYNWKGGRRLHSRGYVCIYSPDHPFCTRSNYVFEHRLVVEKQIGRYLAPEESVHHLSGKIDNHSHMLMAFVSQSAHKRFERGGNVNPSEIIFDGRKQRELGL